MPVATTDFIAIARDIAQESCLRTPITESEQISNRHAILAAARAVKEMCNNANDKMYLEEDIPKLILYCALVVEYAAEFVVRNPHKEVSDAERYVH